MVLRVKFCDSGQVLCPLPSQGGRPRLQEVGLSGESKWLPELPLVGEACML